MNSAATLHQFESSSLALLGRLPRMLTPNSILHNCHFAFFALATLASASAHSQTWACVADAASGFVFREGKWEPANLKSSSKYIISKAESFDAKSKWIVRKTGQQSTEAFCDHDFGKGGHLFCRGIGSNFNFNRKNLRYLNALSFGYTTDGIPGDDALLFRDSKEGDNQPFIEIGRCTQIGE